MNELNTTDLAIAERIITNSHWASIYFAYFESSNDFCRSKKHHLDDDVLAFLHVNGVGLPRLSAICLCRLWDQPGEGRHSLPALVKSSKFASISRSCDKSFVRDVNRFRDGLLMRRLRKFRVSDLAHNLSFEATGRDDSFALVDLKLVLTETHLIIDRLVRILGRSDAAQEAIFEAHKSYCNEFWIGATAKILKQAS